MQINEIQTNNYVSKSALPDADYVINPYIGCPHKCIYCYAEFMKRFSDHGGEEWGEFLDVKRSTNPLTKMQKGTTVLCSSVTDCYNPFEKKYQLMIPILKELKTSEANIHFLTKSDLILRDIDLLMQLKNIEVGISINSLDDDFRKKTEPHASSVDKRFEALKKIKESNITTYLFMSPIFPEITDWQGIIERAYGIADFICFENLNLRGAYMPRVMNFIRKKYPKHEALYNSIYQDKNITYWESLKEKIINYCKKNNVNYKMYFYHDQIKKNK